MYDAYDAWHSECTLQQSTGRLEVDLGLHKSL